MALPRSKYVQEGQEGIYHCYCRCVRRAYLCGYDTLTHRDFSHRKAWLVKQLRHLAAIFAIDVCAYAIMEDHYHTILRTRPDIVAGWSDLEVATRWITLFPRQHKHLPVEERIRALMHCSEQIAKLRKRLSSLSWFMGRLNEFIARAANKEDGVKGRFWESRFKCQALLDEAAIAACMAYVDLNPIRAGLAATPEESNFTSIQERIRAWQKETTQARQATHSGSLPYDMPIPEKDGESSNPVPEHISPMSDSFDDPDLSAPWLCPIESESHRRGILPMTAAEYFDLVDRSGRLTRLDKRGAIKADLAPILLRIGANPEMWLETVSKFGSKFHLAAGLLSSLRRFAGQLGLKWISGLSAARIAFASLPPQLT